MLNACGAWAEARHFDHALTPRLRLKIRGPNDPEWPSAAQWDELHQQTGARLIPVRSPIEVCRNGPDGTACRDVFKQLKNPYYIGDQVGLTQTAGWVDAWTFQPSIYAVATETTADVVAAVNFARDNNLRLVVKGGGHSYLGRSNAPDSLLIWTRRMNAVVRHEAFLAAGCALHRPLAWGPSRPTSFASLRLSMVSPPRPWLRSARRFNERTDRGSLRLLRSSESERSYNGSLRKLQPKQSESCSGRAIENGSERFFEDLQAVRASLPKLNSYER